MQLPFAWTGIQQTLAVSLGRSQRHLTVSGLPARHRTSGGGAVLMGPWLLRALLVVPRSHPALQHGPARAADWFGQIHLDCLAGQGIEAAFYDGRLVDHWSCFSGRAPGELMVDGRKLTGISQTWRRKRALLWSGTLVQRVSWPLLCEAMGKPPQAQDELAATTVSMEELGCLPGDLGAAAANLRAALAAAAAAAAAAARQ